MVKLQTIHTRSGISTKKSVDLSNINTDDYQLSQITDFVNSAVSDVTTLLANQSKSMCVVALTTETSLSADDNIPFNTVLYDPYSVFNNHGTFRSPISGPLCVSGVFYAEGGSSGTMLSLYINNESYCNIGVYRGSGISFCFTVTLIVENGDSIKIVSDGSVTLSTSAGTGSNQLCMRWS